MTHKKSITARLGLGLLIALVVTSVAACQGTPENRPKNQRGETQIDFLTEQLDLTDDQAGKIRDILDATAEQAREDKALYNGSDEAKAEMAKIRTKSMNDQIRAILSEEQKVKFDTIKDQLPPRRPRRAGGDIGQRVQHLTERLELSDEQTTQVEEILTEMQPQLDQLREEMQKNRGNREAMRPKMQEMRAKRDEINEQIEQVLTDEQIEEYQKYQDEQRQQMREGRGRGGRRGSGRP